MTLRILAIATNWDRTAGGVSVFNLELCRNLASLGHSVTCAIITPKLIFKNESEQTLELHDVNLGPKKKLLESDFDLIIGHGLHTGYHAKFYRDEYFNKAKYVQIQHVDHTIEHFKDKSNDSRIDEKEKDSIALLSAADFAAGVGPKLTGIVRNYLNASTGNRPPVLNIRPGIPKFLSPTDISQHTPSSMLLFSGRTDDPKLKGIDLAAKIASVLSKDGSIKTLRIRGITKETKTEIDKLVKKNIKNSSLEIDTRQFGGEAEIISDLKVCDCVIMPSRKEGFGLSAYESLSIGKPTVFSSNSGLYLLLKDIFGKKIEQITVTNVEDIDDWVKKIKWAISDDAKDFFGEIKLKMIEECQWEKSVANFIEQILQ